MSTISAFFAVVAPTAVYTLLLWWLDRYEKEPWPLILAAFLWGALPAIFLAISFEVFLSRSLAHLAGAQNWKDLGFEVWVLAPLVEEPIKGIALLILFFFVRHEFDGPLDGIVYGALIGFGFSMTENLIYILQYSDVDSLFWLRGVLFGLNHAFFTSMFGLSLGAVRYIRSKLVCSFAIIGGLLVSVLFHALHNYVVRYQFAGMLLSWLIQSSGVVVVLAVAVLAWRHERRWMVEELGEEIRAGVISLDDYGEVISSFMRLRRQVVELFTHGWVRFWQVRRLHHLITKLAFRKSQTRIDDTHPADSCDRLRNEIIELRQVMANHEHITEKA
jgi:RsiW-degrading membrane proteinase PrsW (M82 family)